MTKAPPPPPIIEPNVKAEMEALTTIMALLEPLTKDQRSRVLRYARDFFNVYMGDL